MTDEQLATAHMALTSKQEALYAQTNELVAVREQLAAMKQICRDAYEVWAGSEGIPEPETAAEAYLYQLLIAMRDEVKRGLKCTTNV